MLTVQEAFYEAAKMFVGVTRTTETVDEVARTLGFDNEQLTDALMERYQEFPAEAMAVLGLEFKMGFVTGMKYCQMRAEEIRRGVEGG